MSDIKEILGSYDDPEMGLVYESRDIIRTNLTDLIVQYKSAERDWNSTTRQAIALEINKNVTTLIGIRQFLEYEEEVGDE